MPQTKTESYSLLLCRNKGKGKSIRKRIRASFRRKSTRDKQKKLEQEKQELEELEAAREAAADIIVTTSEMKTPPATPGGILKKSGSGKGVSKKTAKVRKTSNFLTVEDGIRHLSLSGGSDTDNELWEKIPEVAAEAEELEADGGHKKKDVKFKLSWIDNRILCNYTIKCL